MQLNAVGFPPPDQRTIFLDLIDELSLARAPRTNPSGASKRGLLVAVADQGAVDGAANAPKHLAIAKNTAMAFPRTSSPTISLTVRYTALPAVQPAQPNPGPLSAGRGRTVAGDSLFAGLGRAANSLAQLANGQTGECGERRGPVGPGGPRLYIARLVRRRSDQRGHAGCVQGRPRREPSSLASRYKQCYKHVRSGITGGPAAVPLCSAARVGDLLPYPAKIPEAHAFLCAMERRPAKSPRSDR